MDVCGAVEFELDAGTGVIAGRFLIIKKFPPVTMTAAARITRHSTASCEFFISNSSAPCGACF